MAEHVLGMRLSPAVRQQVCQRLGARIHSSRNESKAGVAGKERAQRNPGAARRDFTSVRNESANQAIDRVVEPSADRVAEIGVFVLNRPRTGPPACNRVRIRRRAPRFELSEEQAVGLTIAGRFIFSWARDRGRSLRSRNPCLMM
jgi:hypothetical protein